MTEVKGTLTRLFRAPLSLKKEIVFQPHRTWTWSVSNLDAIGLELGRDSVFNLDAIWSRTPIQSIRCSVLRPRLNSVSDPDPIRCWTWTRFGVEPGRDSVLNRRDSVSNLEAIRSRTWMRFGLKPGCDLVSNLDVIRFWTWMWFF